MTKITAVGTPSGVRDKVIDLLDGSGIVGQKLRSATEELIEELSEAELLEVRIEFNEEQTDGSGTVNSVSVKRIPYLA